MIRNDAEMRVNLDLIEGMYRAIVALKRDIAPKNFTNYLILAEGPIEQIRRLRAEIDEYLGITGAVSRAEEDARDLVRFEERENEPARPFSLAESSQPRSGDSNITPRASQGK